MVVACWLYLIDMVAMMHRMAERDAMALANVLLAAKHKEWSQSYFFHMLLMWIIMMIAMMVPTAVRTLMIFSRITTQYSKPAVTYTYCFLAGYIAVWTGFSLIATLLQWQLDQLGLLSPVMSLSSKPFTAVLLIIAGIYQCSALKNACLKQCQSPMAFISEHFKPGPGGSFTMGLQHGGYCLGCCWILMLLLFLAGVMNLIWIILITMFVLLEKMLPLVLPRFSPYGGYVTGFTLIIAGVAVWLL